MQKFDCGGITKSLNNNNIQIDVIRYLAEIICARNSPHRRGDYYASHQVASMGAEQGNFSSGFLAK
jgi:hypothetical protein